MASQAEGDSLKFSAQEYERRHRKIRQAMQLRGIDCLIIAGHAGEYGAWGADSRYVAGVAGNFEGPYIIFPLFADPVILAPSPSAAKSISQASPVPAKPV